MDDALRERLGALGRVVTARPLGGGDFASAYVIDLAGGERVFAKTHRHPPPGFFTTEADGLRWLGAADAVAVPDVLLVADDDPACLVLEWVETGGRRTRETEAEFGRRLAVLHQAGAPSFGREDGCTTGSLALPNEAAANWAEFYAQRRLLPLARVAADRSALSAATIDRVERISSRLDDYGGADEAPARLHGDLWAGNRLVDAAGTNWLIDPAAHGGHREFDLAMMRLFGGYGDEAFAAYERAAPLVSDWERRIDLHQLAPLIVHAVKFGGGYAGAVDTALDRLGA